MFGVVCEGREADELGEFMEFEGDSAVFAEILLEIFEDVFFSFDGEHIKLIDINNILVATSATINLSNHIGPNS